MGVISMARDIKKLHPEYVVSYKIGTFVQTFGKDAYIISYLLGYSIKSNKENIPICGYPKRAIAKVCSKLERMKINYIIIDTRNNYEIDEKNDNRNLNNYDEILLKAHNYVKIKKRLENIESYILEKTKQEDVTEKIKKIEEIAYENREV